MTGTIKYTCTILTYTLYSVLFFVIICCRYSQSVQHMKVKRLQDNRYQFGRSFFDSINALKRHFELEKPVVGGESGKHFKKISFQKFWDDSQIDQQHE